MTGTIIIVAPRMFQRIEREEVRRVEIDHDDDINVWFANGTRIIIETDPDEECPFAGEVQVAIAKAMLEDLSALRCPEMFGQEAITHWEYKPDGITRVNGTKLPSWVRTYRHPHSPDHVLEEDTTEFSVQ